MGIQKSKKGKANPSKQRKATTNKPQCSTPETSTVQEISDTSSLSSHCVLSCIYAGQTGEVEMLRCCLCMNWVHPVCCGDPVEDKDYVGVYTCTKCRLISDKVVSIEAKLDSMFDLNKSLINMLTDYRNENLELRKLVSSLNTEQNNKTTHHCGHKRDKLTNTSDKSTKLNQWSISPEKRHQTTTQLNPLSEEFIPGNMVKITPEGSDNKTRPVATKTTPITSNNIVSSSKKAKSPKTADPAIQHQQANLDDHSSQLLVIGNSMIRESGPIISKQIKNKKTTVLSISGFSINSAISQVPENIQGLNSEQDTVILQLGTVEMQHGDPFVAAAKYSDLIDRMRSIAPCCNIVVCAVPYRLNSKSFNQRADQLNSTLRLMCVRDPKCQFWDINPSATQAN